MLISTYGEALKKMEENVNELEPKLKDKNELTKTALEVQTHLFLKILVKN